MSISRRHFLEAAAATPIAAFAAVDKKTGMPQRVLGKTGAHVSVVAFGCGSRFLAYKEEDKAIEALNRGLDLGISYVDTAYGYGSGVSETRVGKVMKTRRKEVWLTTKINARKGDDAMRIIEGSLKRLQTDQIRQQHPFEQDRTRHQEGEEHAEDRADDKAGQRFDQRHGEIIDQQPAIVEQPQRLRHG